VLEDHARDLLRAPRVVALEPPRVSWTRLARLPEALALRIALRQARRLKLPGCPRVVIVYDPLQTLLGVGLLKRYEDAELWYLRSGQGADQGAPELQPRIADLDRLARRRASIEMSIDELAPLPPERTWFEANEKLWDRLEQLAIAEFA